MRCLDFLYPALLAATSFSALAEAKKPANAVLLSKIQSITVRSGQKTTHRRVSAIPQLKCVGGNARGLYEVDVMRCKNAGASYDAENPDWTCTASLPAHFKLGSTDVVCEGYDSPDDPYILKGSCGVEYRLVLTELGERKFGPGPHDHDHDPDYQHEHHGHILSYLFWMAFGTIALWLAWVFFRVLTENTQQGAGGQRPGWGGGGGGGGPGNDPPPPYDWNPGSSKPYGSSAAPGQQGWRPGFWSGALGGAAAGYYAGRQRNQGETRFARSQPSSSRSYTGGGESSSSSQSQSSSARYESTGFGSTSRR